MVRCNVIICDVIIWSSWRSSFDVAQVTSLPSDYKITVDRINNQDRIKKKEFKMKLYEELIESSEFQAEKYLAPQITIEEYKNGNIFGKQVPF